MATNRIAELNNKSEPASEDMLLIVDDPKGLPSNKHITVESLFTNLQKNKISVSTNKAIVSENLQVEGDIDLKNTATVSDPISITDSGTSTLTSYIPSGSVYTKSDTNHYLIQLSSATAFVYYINGNTSSVGPITINSDTGHELDSSGVYIKFTANTGHTAGDKFVVNVNRESAINFNASSILEEDNDINNTETSNTGTLLLESGVEISQEVDPISLRANSTVLTVTGDTSFANTVTITGGITLSNTIGVTGATTFSNTLGVTGATTLSNTLGVTGATTLSSTVAITGTSTQSGAIILGTETVSGDGAGTDAVSVATPVTFLDTSGGTSSLTMAAGTTGQIKHIIMTVAGNDATMTNTNGNLDTSAVATQILFNAVGESATFIYTGSKWIPISVIGATIS